MKITSIALCVVLLLTATGCVGTAVTFKNTMQKPSNLAATGRQVTGGSCGMQLLLFIPISINGRADRAYQQLMKMAGDDYVADFKVNERWVYAFVGTLYCTDIIATAYPKVAAAAPPSKPQSIDDCIKACKEHTNRTAEQCFDVCNH